MADFPHHIFFFFIIFIFMLLWASSSILASPPVPRCRTSCGSHSIRFPFGIDAGCGNPQFHMICTNATSLQIFLNDNAFFVQHINYNNNTLVLTDPSMSDCANLNFHSAGLDLNLAPNSGFALADSTLLLLNCLAFSQELNLLDNQYDCHNPTCLTFMADCHTSDLLTSCCRVTNPGNQIDLYPMQCTSYTSIYSPQDPIFDPSAWSYGIQLQWNLPSDVSVACNKCESRGGTCGYNSADSHLPFVCTCDYRDSHSSMRCKGCIGESCATWRITRIVVGFTVGVAIIVLTGMLSLFLRARHKRFKTVQDDSVESHDYIVKNPSVELAQVLAAMTGPLPLTLFSYKELVHATASFSDSRLVGDGGYGVVYKAKFCDGRVLAVKRLNHQNHRRLEQFFNEVRLLSQLKHPNLIQLVGFCFQRPDLLLVYEYVANGTLEEHIQCTIGNGLQWETRLNVATEVAEGLAYLHFNINPPIFHRDVKSSNILLSDKFQAKIADFGLSRLVPVSATHVSTAPQGTPGYVDPEYHQSYQLTDKSDVYSFGVVLLELISGKRAVDLSRPSHEVNLSTFAIARIQIGAMEELLDPILVDRESQHMPVIKQVIGLAFKCVALERSERPNMKEIESELQRLRVLAGCNI